MNCNCLQAYGLLYEILINTFIHFKRVCKNTLLVSALEMSKILNNSKRHFVIAIFKLTNDAKFFIYNIGMEKKLRLLSKHFLSLQLTFQ